MFIFAPYTQANTMTTIKERTEIARENKRDIPAILKEIQTLATLSNEVALSCFYVVFNKEDNKPFIGISVRFAELIASCWGNIETGARIKGNNAMSVTVEGFVHDFEKNAVFTVEVQRSLGRMSSERAIQATNAASSIAFRNAIFKAIPAAVTSSVAKNIKEYIVKNINSNNAQNITAYFKSKEVSEQDISNLIGVPLKEIDAEKLFLLIGLRNAIEEGDTTIAEVFGKGEVSTSLRNSKFNFDSTEEDEEVVAEPKAEEVKAVNTPIQEEQSKSDKEVKKETEAIIIEEEPKSTKETKKSLKSGLSQLAETTPKIEEEVIEDEPKEEPQKKRGRGRPRKDED